MKAQPVPGLEPTMGLVQAAGLIVAVRVGELYAFVPAALDERRLTVLHDMRIAAKRLRYVLELVGFCFDGATDELAGRVRELQTLLGDIHDCDVLLARLAHTHSASPKGIKRLTTRLRRRRSELFAQFTAMWEAIEASGLRERIAVATNRSPDPAGMGA